jgi:hypothetical protein
MNKTQKRKAIVEATKLLRKAIENGEDIRLWNYINTETPGYIGFAVRTGTLQSDGTWAKVNEDKFIGKQ